MSWKEFYKEWSLAINENCRADVERILREAGKYTSKATRQDWEWLESALQDSNAKFFVAKVFRRQPVPKKLLAPMIHAAIFGCDASNCNWFIEPCLETFGKEKLLVQLEAYKNSDSAEARDGYEKALYFANRNAWNKRSTSV